MKNWNNRIVQIGLFVFILLGSFTLFGQNIVPNYSFEQMHKCPPDFVTFYRNLHVSNWESANIGTPDYFNACANKCGVPHNWVGSAEAYHGHAYMGLIACMQQYDSRQVSYREYIRVKLKDSLEIGQQYFASMQIRLAESSIASCTGLGMYFSKIDLSSSKNTNFPVNADIISSDNMPVKNKNEWVQICGIYNAEGGEEYLLIGNFLSNEQMDYLEFDPNYITAEKVSPMAYFYIDNIEVYKVAKDSIYACDRKENDLVSFENELPQTGKLVLSNLIFEFDKATILKESYFELDKLAMLLLAKPYIRIELHGHTDNKGSDAYNLNLSEQRAIAVKDYLLRKNVSPRRISSKGFGNSRPVADNSTEEGRTRNRRVEFRVIQ